MKVGRKRGYKHSKETKEKIGIAHLGLKYKGWTKESKKRASISKLKKPTRYWLGKKREHMVGNKHWMWKGGIDAKYRVKNAPRPKTNKCELCEKECKVCYDHDHKTGKFRGWLCSNCNTALGLFKDNIEVLKKAIKYIKSNI